MLDPIEVAKQGQGRDRAERTGIWISGLAHTGLVLWAIVGGALFAARETPRPQTTEVTTISAQEFEEMAARSRGAGPVGQAATRPHRAALRSPSTPATARLAGQAVVHSVRICCGKAPFFPVCALLHFCFTDK